MIIVDLGGAYTAERAAALSGVPESTIRYWANKEYLRPSVSPERLMLWSFTDLMGLRTIYWLRKRKNIKGLEIPRSSMPTVRKAIARLRDLELDLFSAGKSPLAILLSGEIAITAEGEPHYDVHGQYLQKDVINLIAPFETEAGIRGPDLFRPRPHLRIVPRKLSGSPHVEDTRVETQALQALSRRGFSVENITELYPFLGSGEITEALELEEQLARNLRAAA